MRHTRGAVSQEFLLLIAGLCLLAITAAGIFYAIRFIVTEVETALNTKAGAPPTATQFNIEGLKKLKILE